MDLSDPTFEEEEEEERQKTTNTSVGIFIRWFTIRIISRNQVGGWRAESEMSEKYDFGRKGLVWGMGLTIK